MKKIVISLCLGMVLYGFSSVLEAGEPLGIAESGSPEADRIEATRGSELEGAVESPGEARQHQKALDRERGRPTTSSAPPPPPEASAPPPSSSPPPSGGEGDLATGSEPEWLRRGGNPNNPPVYRTTPRVSMKIEIDAEAGTLKTPPFRFGAWVTDLSDRNRSVLDRIADLMKDDPKGLPKVQVGAYTDNSGDPAINEALSIARANVVKAYLLLKGVGVHRLEAKGYGQENPTESNETKQGRAKNRRVEFKIVK